MSYRTRINGVQIFGNNDYFNEWADFLKSKGIEIDEDGCYDGNIDDVMGMFEVIDKITKNLIKERHEEVKKGEKDFKGNPIGELTDLSNSMWLSDDTPVLMFNQQMIENAYCFLPYQVYLAVQDKIEKSKERYIKDGVNWAFCTYKLKEGETIKVHAG